MNNQKKFALSIPASLAFAVSIISYFLPFFKVNGSELLGSWGDLMEWSMVQFVLEVADLPALGEDMLILILLMIVFLVLIPALLAVVGAITSVALKPKTGGIMAAVAGGYGIIALLLWMVIFAQKIDTGFLGMTIQLSDVISFTSGAVVNGIAYVAGLVLGIVMICTAGKASANDGYAGDFQQYDMHQGYNYGEQNYNNDYNNQNYNYNGSYESPDYNNQPFNGDFGGQNQNEPYGGFVDVFSDSNAENVTSRRGYNEFDNENVTVQLTPDIGDAWIAGGAKNSGKILCLAGMFKGAEIPIVDGETIYIGRDPKQCNIIIDKDCVYVGRKHCGITYDASNNRYKVSVYSKNGVLLPNKTRVGENQSVVLVAGSTIELGNSENSFELK